jgi:hypothetical protein
MKSKMCALLLSVVLLSCQKKEIVKIINPRVITSNEDYNAYQQPNTDSLTILAAAQSDENKDASGSEEPLFRLKFGDTVLKIQTSKNDKGSSQDKFSFAQYINSQKTSVLVQVADGSGLVAPFYIVNLTGSGNPEAVSLYRPSSGIDDLKFTKGLSKVGRTGYLINNDFFVTNVNAKVYFIKRINPEERIRGLFFLLSSDKSTLVFLVSSSFYQVNYRSNEVFTQPLAASVPKEPAALINWVQTNFSWRKNKNGVSFLMENQNDDRIIDISEFKK